MKKIFLIISILCYTSLFSETLRILNIPMYSEIIIGDKTYNNETKRSMNIDLKANGLLGLGLGSSSYDVSIINKDFLPYKFSVKIKKGQVSIHTLQMKYAKEFLTNIFVEDINGYLDDCSVFTCIVEIDKGEEIVKNLYKFKETPNANDIDITVKRRGYYNKTKTYDTNKNQKVIISPVSSWALFNIGAIVGVYEDPDLKLSNGDKFMYYQLDTTAIAGLSLSYKKNMPWNFFVGFEMNYLGTEETQDEEDKSPDDGKNFSGRPSIEFITTGASIGYRTNRLFMEAGARQENITIEKTYADKSYTFEESKVAPYISLNYLWWKVGNGGMTLGITGSEALITASLNVVF